MAVRGIVGNAKDVNHIVMIAAAQRLPVLVLDCANCANPHAYPDVFMDKLESVYVIEIELVYKLRDVLKTAFRVASELRCSRIVITTFHRLFHYQDALENKDVYEHAWELIRDLGKTHDVLVAVHPLQRSQAQRYCDELVEVGEMKPIVKGIEFGLGAGRTGGTPHPGSVRRRATRVEAAKEAE